MRQEIKVNLVPLVAGMVSLALLGAAWFFSGNALAHVKKRNVAVLMCSAVLFHEKVFEGIERASQQGIYKKTVRVKPYSFNSLDPMQVSLMAEAAIDAKPDIIISIGILATRTLHEVIRRRQSTVPVVYAGVHNGVELGLIESPERPGGTMTGVMSQGFDPLIPAKLLLIAKPNMKKVVIPYDVTSPSQVLEEETMAVAKAYLEQHGVQVDIVPLDSCHDIFQKLGSFVGNYDTFMGQEVGTIVQHNAGIAKLCSQEGVTFFCSTLEGIPLAAITYATVPVMMGMCTFEQAGKILFAGQRPATLPVVSLQSMRELYVNPAVGALQSYVPDVDQIKRDIAADLSISYLAEKVNVVTA